MKKLFILIISCLFPLMINAQRLLPENFHLRKSAEDFLANSTSQKGNLGAIVTYTKPKDKESSTALNLAGIYSIDFTKPDNYRNNKLSVYIQYDKNTLIDEEQDNLKYGLMYSDNFLSDIDNIGEKTKFRPEFSLSSSFRRDFESNFDAIQTNLIMTPLFLKNNGTLLDTADNSPFDLIGKETRKFNMTYGLNLGVEYDYRFGNDLPALDGNLLRTFSQVKLNLEFFSLISASVDWQYRYSLYNSTELDKSDYSYINLSLEYIILFDSTDPDKNRGIVPAVGLSYIDGENPTNGFQEQSYYALSLSLKIN